MMLAICLLSAYSKPDPYQTVCLTEGNPDLCGLIRALLSTCSLAIFAKPDPYQTVCLAGFTPVCVPWLIHGLLLSDCYLAGSWLCPSPILIRRLVSRRVTPICWPYQGPAFSFPSFSYVQARSLSNDLSHGGCNPALLAL